MGAGEQARERGEVHQAAAGEQKTLRASIARKQPRVEGLEVADERVEAARAILQPAQREDEPGKDREPRERGDAHEHEAGQQTQQAGRLLACVCGKVCWSSKAAGPA